MPESQDPSEQADTEPRLVDAEAMTTAAVRDVVAMADMRDFFDGSFTTLGDVLANQHLTPVSPPYGLYRGMPAETVDVEVGFPVDRPVEPERGVQAGSLPAGRVARVVHHGSFEELAAAWGRLGAWIAQQGLVPGAELWEVYLTEPTPGMDPADLRTELNWLIATP